MKGKSTEKENRMKTKVKILLVDDEPEIIEVVGHLLQKEGFDVISAGSGMEALKKLSEEKVQGVVCDFVMPEMDGIELLKRVREQNNFVPFLFLSGYANPKHAHTMMSLGAHDVIYKPDIDGIPYALKKLVQAQQDISVLEKTDSEETAEFLDILHGKTE